MFVILFALLVWLLCGSLFSSVAVVLVIRLDCLLIIVWILVCFLCCFCLIGWLMLLCSFLFIVLLCWFV